MPVLRNKKHEGFCSGVARGLTDVEAYRKAGYKCTPVCADVASRRLRRRADVRERLDELGEKKSNRIAVEQIALGIKTGRPTLYRPELAEQARRLALLGLNDEDMAQALNIDRNTLGQWKREHVEFNSAIARGGVHADAKVAEATYRRAIGYRHPAVKIMQYEGQVIEVPYTEHYPPDTNAARLWLMNRQPDKWRDRQQVDVTGTFKHRLMQMTPDERERHALDLAERIERRLAEVGITIEHEPGDEE
jgi:hypothetical protein